jgi:hypothetical protein
MTLTRTHVMVLGATALHKFYIAVGLTDYAYYVIILCIRMIIT